MKTSEELLPDLLKRLWPEVDAGHLTAEQFEAERDRQLEEYKRVWAAALLLPGQQDLKISLLTEAGLYVGCDDLEEVEARCRRGVATVRAEWEKTFQAGEAQSAEQFYDQSDAYVYDLMWWHTLLADDLSPLAYVLALRFGLGQACRSHLDFGAGSGAGSILFARHGFDVTLADISSSLLRFSRWRLERRRLPARFLDLKIAELPAQAFDLVTAMDVFEHLVDPVKTTENIWRALKPGGFLLGRFQPAADEEHPQHIVLDFEPTFTRMRELGMVEVWRDDWLWGHQIFQKQT